MKLKSIVIPLVVGIIVYSLIGGILNQTGLTIYHTIPTHSTNSQIIFQLRLQNNAFLTLPFVNSLFSGGVIIVNSTGNVDCSVSSVKGYIPCNSTMIDLGLIDAGGTKYIDVTIVPNKNNFTIDLIGYTNFFFSARKDKFVNCTYLQETYSCSD